MRNRTLLALTPGLIAIAGCAVFRAQHSDEMYHPTLPVAMVSAAAPGVTFDRVQSEILTPRCAIPDCHVTAAPGADEGPPAGLVLEAGKSYDLLVGVRAEQRDLLRIAPGNPDGSYLYRKVTPPLEISWHRMPLEGPALTDAERGLIRDWIASGAKR